MVLTCHRWTELAVRQGQLHGGMPVLRERSPAADAREGTETAHFPAKIRYTTPRDTIPKGRLCRLCGGTGAYE